MKSRRFPLFLAAITLASPGFTYDEVRARPALQMADKKVELSLLRLDPEGNRWILNPKADAIQKISDRGTVAVHIAGKKGPFKEPIDFGFLPDGTLAVLDAKEKRVVLVKAPESKKGSDWKDAKVESDFEVEKPSALAVSKDGIIAVGSGSEHAVELYSRSGVDLCRISMSEKDAFGAVTALAFGPDGKLWILDGDKGFLHRFSPERKLLGSTDGFSGARSLTVDAYGFGYVTLEKGKWIEVDPTGVNTGTFGAKGKLPGQLGEPIGIAADAAGVMVAEAGNRRFQGFDVLNRSKKVPVLSGPAAFIQVHRNGLRAGEIRSALFMPNGEELVKRPNGLVDLLSVDGSVKGTWKKKEKNAPGVAEMAGWTLDESGKIWLTDAGDHTVKNVSLQGDVLSNIGKKGKKEGSLKGPSHLAVRPDGSIVVADRGGSRIQVLSKDGLFLFAVGSQGKKDGQFDSVDGVAANKDVIAVLDGGRKSLLFYSAAGKFQSAISNREGKAANWRDPVSLASDPQGRFYVLDAGTRRVRCFSAKGTFLADFSANGKALACGPNGFVDVIGDKDQTIYEARFVPRASAKVAATDQEGDIKISWDAIGEASMYHVYRSTGDGRFTSIGTSETSSLVDSNVTPAVVYTYAVTGIGAGGHEGVWASAPEIKAARRKDVSLISIEDVTLKPVFTAAFKYYVTSPVGEVIIRNNDEKPYRNVKVSVSLARYTDFATVAMVNSIDGGQKTSVPVTLTLNEKVMELTEDTPVQADVRVTYFEDNVEKTVSHSAPIKLYGRNAISWSEKGRLSSFVTPRDTPIAEFSRTATRSFMKELKSSTVGKPLAKALLFYEAVNALGISYVPDPNTPFNVVSGKPEVIDYTQFPRETLRRKTGDCDDTTALMSALLESIGVQTAIVDMPGHVLLMANLEEGDAGVIGLPEERFVFLNGTYWVPIETTQFGHGFLEAWQSGIAEIKAAQAKGTVTFVPISEASKVYPPITLLEADQNSAAFPEEKVRGPFMETLIKLQKERYANQMSSLKTQMKDDPDNKWLKIEVAMVEFEGGDKAVAKPMLEALTVETEAPEIRSAAENNLGNISYLNGEYKSALAYYDAAWKLTPDDGGVVVNQARAAWKLGDIDHAKKLIEEGSKSLKDWREYVGDLPPELIPK